MGSCFSRDDCPGSELLVHFNLEEVRFLHSLGIDRFSKLKVVTDQEIAAWQPGVAHFSFFVRHFKGLRNELNSTDPKPNPRPAPEPGPQPAPTAYSRSRFQPISSKDLEDKSLTSLCTCSLFNHSSFIGNGWKSEGSYSKSSVRSSSSNLLQNYEEDDEIINGEAPFIKFDTLSPHIRMAGKYEELIWEGSGLALLNSSPSPDVVFREVLYLHSLQDSAALYPRGLRDTAALCVRQHCARSKTRRAGYYKDPSAVRVSVFGSHFQLNATRAALGKLFPEASVTPRLPGDVLLASRLDPAFEGLLLPEFTLLHGQHVVTWNAQADLLSSPSTSSDDAD